MPVYQLDAMVPDIHPSAYIAPTAAVIGNVHLEKDVSVWFNCVLRGDENHIHIGEHTNIQDLTMVHVDPDNPVVIGKHVTIGHSCIIHGCTVEDQCLIGIGATLLSGAVIGSGSIVAAGSVVLENTRIPPNSMVTGIPGKVKKSNSAEMQQIVTLMAEVYVEESKRYGKKHGLSLVNHLKEVGK